MTVKQRIIQYVEYRKISARKFSVSIGASPGYVNAISKSIQPDKLSRISELYPDLNTEWLMTGKGSMLKSENTEIPAYEIEQPDLNFTNMDLQRLLSAIEQHGEELKKQGERLDRVLDLVTSSNQSRVG